jgi:hypothetical protein
VAAAIRWGLRPRLGINRRLDRLELQVATACARGGSPPREGVRFRRCARDQPPEPAVHLNAIRALLSRGVGKATEYMVVEKHDYGDVDPELADSLPAGCDG